jgi:hypothetical protein
MTNDQIMAMFEKIGGVDEVNKEANIIFDVFGTNEVLILQERGTSALSYYPQIMTNHPEVKGFPAIFALGDAVLVLGGATNEAPEIQIKFGTHRNGKTVDIFPPSLDLNKATNFSKVSFLLNDPSYLRVTNNIFAWKGKH